MKKTYKEPFVPYMRKKKCPSKIIIQSLQLFNNDVQNLMIHLNELYLPFQQKQYFFLLKKKHNLEEIQRLRIAQKQIILSIFDYWSTMSHEPSKNNLNNMIVDVVQYKSIKDYYEQSIKYFNETDDIQLQVFYEEHIDTKKKIKQFEMCKKEWIPNTLKYYYCLQIVPFKPCSSDTQILYKNQYESIVQCVLDPESLFDFKPKTTTQNSEKYCKKGFIFGIPVVVSKTKIMSDYPDKDQVLYQQIYDIIYNQHSEQEKTLPNLWNLIKTHNSLSYNNAVHEALNGVTLSHVGQICPHYSDIYHCSIDFEIFEKSKMIVPYVVQIKENLTEMSLHTFNQYISYHADKIQTRKEYIRLLIEKMNILGSIFVQLLFALFCGQTSVSFVHRNLNSRNVLILNVEKNTNLYYEYEGNIYKIPTMGNLVVLQDYSKSTVKTRNHYSEPMDITFYYRSLYDVVDFQYLDLMNFFRNYFRREDPFFIQELFDYQVEDDTVPFRKISTFFLSCGYALNSKTFQIIHPSSYKCEPIHTDPYPYELYQNVNIETSLPNLETGDEPKTTETHITDISILDVHKNNLYKNIQSCSSCAQQEPTSSDEKSFESWHPITLKKECSKNASIQEWMYTKTAKSYKVEWEQLNNHERSKIIHIKDFDYYR